jgi:hypothetical protein
MGELHWLVFYNERGCVSCLQSCFSFRFGDCVTGRNGYSKPIGIFLRLHVIVNIIIAFVIESTYLRLWLRRRRGRHRFLEFGNRFLWGSVHDT